MKMKIVRGTFVSILMCSCLNPTFVLPDPSLYGWKSVDGSWESVWFEGKYYPDPTEQDKSEVEGGELGDGNKDNKDDDHGSDDSDSDCPEALMVIPTKLITFLLVLWILFKLSHTICLTYCHYISRENIFNSILQ